MSAHLAFTLTPPQSAWKLAAFCLALIIPLGATPVQDSDDLRYLLVRRAGFPEKNYYDFARVVGILDPDLEFHGPIDVVTQNPGGVRYGVDPIYPTPSLRGAGPEKQTASSAAGPFLVVLSSCAQLE